MSSIRYQLFQKLDGVGEVGGGVGCDWLVTVIGTPNGDPLLIGFLGLQRAEDRSIKFKNT